MPVVDTMKLGLFFASSAALMLSSISLPVMDILLTPTSWASLKTTVISFLNEGWVKLAPISKGIDLNLARAEFQSSPLYTELLTDSSANFTALQLILNPSIEYDKAINKNLMLHSYQIRFMINKKKYTYTALLPDYFKKLLKIKRLKFEDY